MAKKLKTVLISQPKPTTEKSPYFDLADRQKLTIDFRPFIHVEGVEPQDFRQQRIDLAEHTAVILTSRNAGSFFRLAADCATRCPTPEVPHAKNCYPQKCVLHRKRKILKTPLPRPGTVSRSTSKKALLPCSDG